jgi:hypothetical protein
VPLPATVQALLSGSVRTGPSVSDSRGPKASPTAAAADDRPGRLLPLPGGARGAVAVALVTLVPLVTLVALAALLRRRRRPRTPPPLAPVVPGGPAQPRRPTT